MSYSELKKLKKQSPQSQGLTKYLPFLVVGEDIFSYELYNNLKESHPGEGAEGKWLSPQKIEKAEDLYWHGPSRIRGENLEHFSKWFERDQVVQSEFYKDSQFHSYGGRVKGQELLFSEAYFTGLGALVREQELLPKALDHEFLGIDQTVIKKIEKVEPKDLVKPIHWRIITSSETVYEVNHLYWGHQVPEFFRLLGNESGLSSEEKEKLAQLKTPSEIVVNFKFKTSSDLKKTWFLPLSQTHEWGHFIGDFYQYEGLTEACFLHYFDEKEVNEDELAKKLRILKRHLEKNIKDFKNQNIEESVRFRPYSDCQKIDDLKFKFVTERFGNLKLFGSNCLFSQSLREDDSFEDSFLRLSHFLRGYLSTRSLFF